MPYLVLLTSLVVLSQSGIFIRLANTDATAIGFWRMILALPVLVFLLLWKKHMRVLRELSGQQWIYLVLCGFFLFAHFYTWFLSVQKTSLAHSMILFCTNPLFTALGAWLFFQEKLRLSHGVAMVFCFVGIYLLLSEKGGTHSLEGDLLGVVCSVLFSAYVLTGKGLRAKLPNIPFAIVTYSACAFFFFVLMLSQNVPFFEYSTTAWLAFAALAYGSTILGHSLFTHCLQYFHVNVLSISTLVEPALTALSGYLIFQEKVGFFGILGFCFVGFGIFTLYLPFFRREFLSRRT
jgi:drug/metabolite transporter (DMT)-like permease